MGGPQVAAPPPQCPQGQWPNRPGEPKHQLTLGHGIRHIGQSHGAVTRQGRSQRQSGGRTGQNTQPPRNQGALLGGGRVAGVAASRPPHREGQQGDCHCQQGCSGQAQRDQTQHPQCHGPWFQRPARCHKTGHRTQQCGCCQKLQYRWRGFVGQLRQPQTSQQRQEPTVSQAARIVHWRCFTPKGESHRLCAGQQGEPKHRMPGQEERAQQRRHEWKACGKLGVLGQELHGPGTQPVGQQGGGVQGLPDVRGVPPICLTLRQM